MLKGSSGIIDNPKLLGVAAESAALKHLFAGYYEQSIRFSYWRGKKDLEVDLVAEIDGELIPFEMKYRSQHSSLLDCKGLVNFCAEKTSQEATSS